MYRSLVRGLLLTTLLATPAQFTRAQSFSFSSAPTFANADCVPLQVQPFPNQGFRPGYGGLHASTFAEGYLRGVAAVTAAQGQAVLLQSEALKNQEIARNMFLQNRRFNMQQVFEWRRFREAESERRKAKLLARNLERRQQKELQQQPAVPPQQAAPPPAQFARWPFPLQDIAFAAHRRQIEGLISLRADLPVTKRGPTDRAIQLALQDLFEELQADPVTEFWSTDQKESVQVFLASAYAITNSSANAEPNANELDANSPENRQLKNGQLVDSETQQLAVFRGNAPF